MGWVLDPAVVFGGETRLEAYYHYVDLPTVIMTYEYMTNDALVTMKQATRLDAFPAESYRIVRSFSSFVNCLDPPFLFV